MDHVFVKQGLLDSLGFVYGKAKVRTGRSLNVRVRRIASGRWEALPAFSASLPRAPLQHRIVSEQEALSGIGTFESCVCVPHVGDHSTRTWSYGVVVGYEWKTEAPSSLLHVDFGDKTDAVLFDSSVLQDIAMATYALRPCNSRLVADVMPGEMREIKKVAYDTFMGVNGMATRDSTRIRGSVQAGPLDETQRVPLYEFTAGRVVLLQIQHILDFGFYQDGNRSVPSGMHLGSTIFDYEPPALHVELTLPSQEEVPGNPATASPAIPSDVDASSNLPVSGRNTGDNSSSKRRRDAGARAPSQSAGRAGSRTALLDEYEEFLAFERSRSRGIAESENWHDSRDVAKAPFRPSALQQTTHRVLVNDLMVFRSCVLRVGINAIGVKRNRKYDFGDFTAKNKLPAAAEPLDITDLVAALEMLAQIVRKVYKATVCEIVEAATSCVHLLSEDVSVLPPRGSSGGRVLD
ncbi:hypothetical protein PF005_g16417 [Phytophthora fragariae]|uniref:Uncharacterized protein n=1 Tax=Phytophthora fragariae TaxID=53985 RepID=A0A6A3RL84_9STRA|nr:hypothetical protein PF003_g7141 [Phytophthora fragariae]KAE9099589.1 hypothetical protein PF007_g15819 [Phytophthora fragariae]KAE9197689.1 hypothetical protein PF005_g16417 [Phytophthora fragariae]